MTPSKQILFEPSQELREIIGGEAQSDSDNPTEVLFGTEPDESSSSSSDSEEDDRNNETAEEFFNLSIDDQNFY